MKTKIENMRRYDILRTDGTLWTIFQGVKTPQSDDNPVEKFTERSIQRFMWYFEPAIYTGKYLWSEGYLSFEEVVEAVQSATYPCSECCEAGVIQTDLGEVICPECSLPEGRCLG